MTPIGTPWVNTISYVPVGVNQNLLQKLSPGDFNGDKFVNFADVQIAGAATKPGLPGNGIDTYDFNGDGDSTFADTTYMITSIMDRLVGDIAQDALVSDVDNADIGRAIGASAVGTLYLEGDIDFDGVVDADDITAVAAVFTGAKTPGKWTYGTPGATLRYLPSNGQVWLKADEANGFIITSFQLENAAGTFVPANYTGPTGVQLRRCLGRRLGQRARRHRPELDRQRRHRRPDQPWRRLPHWHGPRRIDGLPEDRGLYRGRAPVKGSSPPSSTTPSNPPNVLTLAPDGVDSKSGGPVPRISSTRTRTLTGFGTVTFCGT